MKRLLLATVVSIAMMSVLGLLASYFTQGLALASATPLGYTDPVSCLIISIANGIGGWIAGRRFIAVALAIMTVSWVAGLYVLTGIAAAATTDTAAAFAQIMANNGLQIALSTLAAVTGAAIGAWRRAGRAHAPVD